MELKDDFEILDLMLADSKNQPPLYNPGPYWMPRAKNAANEIKRCGISKFRGSDSFIGMSYADNLFLDNRQAFNYGIRKTANALANTYPFKRIYDSQVILTENYAKTSITYMQEILNLKQRTKQLLKKYKMPYSLLGDCKIKATIDDKEYAVLYLNLLEQHDNLAQHVDFTKAKTVFEIGGGFGTNVHLLLENYKNIRKVLYLDIAPNLYVGTQYLKAFYGAAVHDYRELRKLDEIKFSNNDDLEIFCIAPRQIENFKGPIDIFMNAHSFVEMPKNVVKNYADKINGFVDSKNSAIALTTYDCFDLTTTYHPEELPKFFDDRKFEHFEIETLLDSKSKNIYFVSPGKFQL